MVGTSHFLIGGSIGIIAGNPWVALPAAFASHYLLDTIPHREYTHQHIIVRDGKLGMLTDILKGGIDLLVGIVLVAWLTHGDPLALAAGGAAILPDAFHVVDHVLAHRNGIPPPGLRDNPYKELADTLTRRLLSAQRHFHCLIQRWEPQRVPYWIGFLTQGGTAFLGIWMLTTMA